MNETIIPFLRSQIVNLQRTRPAAKVGFTSGASGVPKPSYLDAIPVPPASSSHSFPSPARNTPCKHHYTFEDPLILNGTFRGTPLATGKEERSQITISFANDYRFKS